MPVSARGHVNGPRHALSVSKKNVNGLSEKPAGIPRTHFIMSQQMFTLQNVGQHRSDSSLAMSLSTLVPSDSMSTVGSVTSAPIPEHNCSKERGYECFSQDNQLCMQFNTKYNRWIVDDHRVGKRKSFKDLEKANKYFYSHQLPVTATRP